LDTAAVVTMVLILTLVWGGFAAFLILAWKQERKKKNAE
jgi:hypothetical protein